MSDYPRTRQLFACLAVAAGLTAANFLYQMFGGNHWALATERSWLQVGAIFAVWLTLATSAPVGRRQPQESAE